MDSIKRAVNGPWGSAAGLMADEGTVNEVSRLFPYQEEPEKGRLLLSPLFLRKPVLDSVRGSLAGLKELAAHDRGEWIEMLSTAVGDYDGRIHTEKVLERLPHVKTSINEVEALAEGIDPALHRPLVEKYLSDEVLAWIGGLKYKKQNAERKAIKSPRGKGQKHFTLREPPSTNAINTSSALNISDEMPHTKAGYAPPPASNGFGALPEGRKRPAMPGSAPEASMFLKPAKPTKIIGRGGAAAPVKKKPVVLDITSVKQMQTVTKKRRVDLQKEKEEQKEKEAQERAEERQQKKEDLVERRKFMHDAEKRKREEKREEAREKKRPTKAPVDGAEVAEALKAARSKADVESAKDTDNVGAYNVDVEEEEEDYADFI